MLALSICVPPAGASVTLGQLGPNNTTCGASPPADIFQASIAAGNSYVVPGTGTITSWSNNSAPVAGQTLTLKVFRKITDPDVYTVVGHDGPRQLNNGILSTFAASVPAKAGDLIGYNVPGTTGTSCDFTTGPGDSIGVKSGPTPGFNLADGESATFNSSTGVRLNLTAVFEPSNTVTVGKTTQNRKKGTATLNLSLPNAGDLTASGKGVKASSAGGAVVSKAVGAGAAQLLVKAKGKQLKTLNSTGKVKLGVKLTYTPQNGEPGTQTVKVKLRKG